VKRLYNPGNIKELKNSDLHIAIKPDEMVT